ncbi:MAG: hypothetical protein ACYDDF_12185 [Thermoplasmatota archaeon]
MDEDVFRAAYEADPTNAKRQPLAEYLRWVRIFYEGRSFPPVPGWNAREREIVSRVGGAGQATVAETLAALGRRLGGEWAKDNATRKVSTDDLRAFGKRLEEAARGAPAQREATILGALAEIQAELDRRGVRGDVRTGSG